MRDCLVLLTTYNRPKLVVDAIRSIREQDCDRWRLAILDDGSDPETRQAINDACDNPPWVWHSRTADGVTVGYPDNSITWWRGPQRNMEDRKATIPYSRTINLALNHLRRPTDTYVCYFCDDDFAYPEAIRARADYLDAHPDVHVVYGRMRSIQYAPNGFNTWEGNAAPQAGRAFPRPTGERVHVGGGGKYCYFPEGETDPQTGLPYVEEGYWEPGPLRYGDAGSTDHNQVMHRVECLDNCGVYFPLAVAGHTPKEYWGEDQRHGVGDAAFFRMLGAVHEFVGIDAWIVTKRFHVMSDGVSSATRRD